MLVLTRRIISKLEPLQELKRYVLSHDGTDATDKQITVLETMEVNIDDLRRIGDLRNIAARGEKEVDATVPEIQPRLSAYPKERTLGKVSRAIKNRGG